LDFPLAVEVVGDAGEVSVEAFGETEDVARQPYVGLAVGGTLENLTQRQ